jgi:hypothetical protein
VFLRADCKLRYNEFRYWDPADLANGGLVQDVVRNLERLVEDVLGDVSMGRSHILFDRTVIMLEMMEVMPAMPAAGHKNICKRRSPVGSCPFDKCVQFHCYPSTWRRRCEAVLKVELGYFETNDTDPANERIYVTMEDAVKRRLACPDGDVHRCTVRNCLASCRRVKFHVVSLPRVLVVGTEDERLRTSGDGVPIEKRIDIFGKLYTLVAIVFYVGEFHGVGRMVGGHYVLRMKLGTTWYEYDDMEANAATGRLGLVKGWGSAKENDPTLGGDRMMPRLWYYLAKNDNSQFVRTTDHGYAESYFQCGFGFW